MVVPVDHAVKRIWMEMKVVRGVRPPFTWREWKKPQEACHDSLYMWHIPNQRCSCFSHLVQWWTVL